MDSHYPHDYYIFKTKSQKYYLCLPVKIQNKEIPSNVCNSDKIIAIDPGNNTFINALSTNKSFKYKQQYLEKEYHKIDKIRKNYNITRL